MLSDIPLVSRPAPLLSIVQEDEEGNRWGTLRTSGKDLDDLTAAL